MVTREGDGVTGANEMGWIVGEGEERRERAEWKDKHY